MIYGGFALTDDPATYRTQSIATISNNLESTKFWSGSGRVTLLVCMATEEIRSFDFVRHGGNGSTFTRRRQSRSIQTGVCSALCAPSAMLSRSNLPSHLKASSMLSVIRHSLPSPCRILVRRNVVNLNRKYHAKVSGLRFIIIQCILGLHMEHSSSVRPLQG